MCALSETSSWLCLEAGAVYPDCQACGGAAVGFVAPQNRLYFVTRPIIHTNFITEYMGKCLYLHSHNLRENLSNTTSSSGNEVLGCWGAI